MLSTNLQKRAQEDIDFKFQNIEALQTTILELDDQKLLYDQGIVKIEKQVLEDLNVVNRAFDDVSNAYQDAIGDCHMIYFGEWLIFKQVVVLILMTIRLNAPD